MNETRDVFNERKKELEFYYSVLVEFEDSENNKKDKIITTDNAKFFRILKSNYLLMMYNIVESTVTNGMREIYELVKRENCSYKDVIIEIQNIWRNYKIREVYNSSQELQAYTNRVKAVVDDITNNAPIILTRNMLNISGNLDAKTITSICDEHRIRYKIDKDACDCSKLKKVKDDRNALAHGSVSFSECARNLTLSDLEVIKDSVVNFLSYIIDAMDKYCDEKLFLQSSYEE